jgi:V/A-type H+/Na+-transporting ATPase subunit I
MATFLINTPEPMMKVRVIAIKDQSQQTLERLQELGVLHIEEASDLSPLDRDRIETERRRIREAIVLLDDIISYLPEPKTVFIGDAGFRDTRVRVIDEVTRLHRSFSRIIAKFNGVKDELTHLEMLDRHLGSLEPLINPLVKDLQYSGRYLYSNVIVLSDDTFRIFRDKTETQLFREVSVSPEEGMVVAFFIAGAEYRRQIETIIRDLGITVPDIPDSDLTLSDFLARNREAIARSREESAKTTAELLDTIGGQLETIALFREILTAEFGRYTVLLQAAEARYVTLIEGWAPEVDAGPIESRLKESIGDVFVEMSHPIPVDRPPTKLRNSKGVQPFEVIVRLFSLPRYGDWDPTPSVAYFFAFFFGLMLNDLVYALGLLFLARFVLDKLVDEPDSEGTRLFRKVLYISGGVSVVFSILSGTYLGDFPSKFLGMDLTSIALLKPVQTVLNDPISFIILALVIGIIHLNLAHVLALIKAVRERDRGTIVSKIGLFLIQLFGIPYLMYVMFNLPLGFLSLDAGAYQVFLYIVYFGVILLIIGSVMTMRGLGSFFWIFDLTGILGDIMSYSRLAGVGLATFYLASSFNLLSGWIADIAGALIPGFPGQVAAFLVATILLVMFHLLNLLLSSLAAFIHSLRLCFVEYLLKFYEGGGRDYVPFHMRFRREVVLGK